MNDPSSGVPPHLLRHVHLVCNHSFPVMPRPDLSRIYQYLQEAPRLVRDQVSMTWLNIVDPPRDGTVMLVWQPPNMISFPSDGYIWVDAEKSRAQQMGPYFMEMYAQNSGYRPGESMTMHARRRYRLTPPREPAPNPPHVDPCLWLVNYFPAEPANQIPSASMPLSDYTRQLLTERNALQARGQLQLQHNEFMLHDRNKWPSISLPGTAAPQYAQQAMGYPNNVMAQMSRTQHPGFVQHPQTAVSQAGTGPSPAKRARHASMGQGHASAAALPQHLMARDLANEDETSTSVDYMDVMTPREISALRYEQHHEWLEEILNSPYETHQIVPGELGLGKKGELESLTRDFFIAHTERKVGRVLDPPSTPGKKHYEQGLAVVPDDPAPRVGRMEDGKFEEFRQLKEEWHNKVRREMDKMTELHEERMRRISQGRKDWEEAINSMRTATLSAMNGKADGTLEDGPIEEIKNKVTHKFGKQIKPVENVTCISQGGLEDKADETLKPYDQASTQNMALENGHQQQESSITASLLQDPTPKALPENGASKFDSSASIQPPPKPEASSATIANGQGAEDWVMIDKDGGADDRGPGESALDTLTSDAIMHFDEKAAGLGNITGPQDTAATTFMEPDFESGLDFTDFNTTGADLVDYAQGLGNLSADGHQTASLDGNTGASIPPPNAGEPAP